MRPAETLSGRTALEKEFWAVTAAKLFTVAAGEPCTAPFAAGGITLELIPAENRKQKRGKTKQTKGPRHENTKGPNLGIGCPTTSVDRLDLHVGEKGVRIRAGGGGPATEGQGDGAIGQWDLDRPRLDIGQHLVVHQNLILHPEIMRIA
jgi:hypothetical protein